jgi:hypothetical protein
LWGLSALFATISVAISEIKQINTNFFAVLAAILWAILFILFFRTKDS